MVLKTVIQTVIPVFVRPPALLFAIVFVFFCAVARADDPTVELTVYSNAEWKNIVSKGIGTVQFDKKTLTRSQVNVKNIETILKKLFGANNDISITISSEEGSGKIYVRVCEKDNCSNSYFSTVPEDITQSMFIFIVYEVFTIPFPDDRPVTIYVHTDEQDSKSWLEDFLSK